MSVDLPQPPSGWVSLPDVAQRLNVPVNGSISPEEIAISVAAEMIAVRRNGIRYVPAELVAGSNVLKHLPGLLTLLHDAGYTDEEALRWLYSPDDSLPGTPATALVENRATEVKRRAQALGH